MVLLKIKNNCIINLNFLSIMRIDGNHISFDIDNEKVIFSDTYENPSYVKFAFKDLVQQIKDIPNNIGGFYIELKSPEYVKVNYQYLEAGDKYV